MSALIVAAFSLTAFASDSAKLTLFDVRTAISAISSGVVNDEMMKYDVNKDGMLNLSDIRAIVELISSGTGSLDESFTVKYIPYEAYDEDLSATLLCGQSFYTADYEYSDGYGDNYYWTLSRLSDGFVFCENDAGETQWFDSAAIDDGYHVKSFGRLERVSIAVENGETLVFKAERTRMKTILFDSSDGEGEMYTIEVAPDYRQKLPKNIYKKDGFDFAGWNILSADDKYLFENGDKTGWYSDGSQPSGYEKKLFSDESTVDLSGDTTPYVTMKAVWKQYYIVQYDPNGASGSMDDTKVYYGVGTPLRRSQYTRPGFDFVCWYASRKSDNKWYYYSEDGGEGWFEKDTQPSGYMLYPYADGSNVARSSRVAGDIVTLHAEWKQYYIVQYDANGGSGSMDDTKVYYGVGTPLRKSQYTRSGFDFIGWYASRKSDNKWYYYSKDGGEGWFEKGTQPSGYMLYPYADGSNVARSSRVAGDIVTLHAEWKQYYIVKFDPNGGSGSMSNIKVYYGEATALTKNKFQKDYKMLSGWYANRKSDNKWYYYSSNGGEGWYKLGSQPSGYMLFPYADGSNVARSSSVAGDIVTMYAQWQNAFRKEVYGKSYQGRELYAYIFNDTPKATKTLFMDFAVHGFEDDYYRDGQVLVNCALKIAEHYKADCSELKNYRLVLIPCANPDGTYAGVNDKRACSTAFGRCTANHVDMNRDFLTFGAQESVYLRDMLKKYKPTVYVNGHGWLDTVLGNKEVGSIFVNTLGLNYNQYGDYGYEKGYIIGWVAHNLGSKSVLLEFASPESVNASKVITCINKIVANVK